MRILALIPSLPEDIRQGCIEAVTNQTLPVSKLVLVSERVTSGTIPARVSKALNNAIAKVNLNDFDYILKVNGDTVIPRDFNETYLKDNPDLCGFTGDAQLIRVEPFIKLLDGKFPKDSDDTAINLLFQAKGLKVTTYKAQILSRRRNGALYGSRYYFDRGTYLYQLGYEPLHAFADIIVDYVTNMKQTLAFFGYIIAVITHKRRFSNAETVWKYQVKRLSKYF